jgi:Tfp pilus assembly protein PilN
MNTARLVAGVVVATLLAAGIVRQFIDHRVDAQLAENAVLETALMPLRRETREVDALFKGVRDVLERNQIIKVLAEDSSPAAEALAELSRLPGDIVLTHVEADGLQIVVEGIARSDAAAKRMVEQLGTMKFIAHPRIASTQAAPSGDPFGAQAQVFKLQAELRH